jgi:hypothetical protein
MFFFVFIGEKFKLYDFEGIELEERFQQTIKEFQLQSNEETTFLDIGMLRVDGANERTVVFYPKGNQCNF